jgi:hypothetical protein
LASAGAHGLAVAGFEVRAGHGPRRWRHERIESRAAVLAALAAAAWVSLLAMGDVEMVRVRGVAGGVAVAA